jgi:PKD repeat protein
MFYRFVIPLLFFSLFLGSSPLAGEPGPSPVPEPDSVGTLTVFADGDETMGEIPLEVQLEVEVLPGTGVPPYRFHWDFGDGTTFSDKPDPVHVYRVAGSFRASVIVVDAREEVDQDYVDVTVHEPLGQGDLSARELRAWVLSRGAAEEVPPTKFPVSPESSEAVSRTPSPN